MRKSFQSVLTVERHRYLVTLALVAAVYFLTGKFGFTLAVVAKQVTAVWPPTGIALAAVLLFGNRCWPGVALGAFLVNLLTEEPLLTAVGIACGNTFEALLGAYLLRRVGFQRTLERLRDVFALVGLAAILSTTVSATIGVISLSLGGLIPCRPLALFGWSGGSEMRWATWSLPRLSWPSSKIEMPDRDGSP